MAAVVAQAEETRFYRISSASNTVLTSVGPDGWMSWSNVVAAGTCAVEAATSLGGADSWQPLVQAPVTDGVSRLQAFDPATPTGLVFVPAGLFQMGDALGDGGNDERPVHPVTVSAFYIGAFETTKAEWDEIYAWSETNGYAITNAGLAKATNHPVHGVNWFSAVQWCNARSENEGLTPCYSVSGSVYRTGQYVPACNWSANGYRLPTEAEWEKAARGGSIGRRFPWNSPDEIRHDWANYFAVSNDPPYDTSLTEGWNPLFTNGLPAYTSPVGSFSANGYGLYDVAGNVWEWCFDWEEYDYYSTSPSTDPRGPASGVARVLRGGSWDDGRADGCRVADRFSCYPQFYINRYNGFRVVRAAGP
ncbi:MAG: hypothetical protein A2X46_14745 [Lentisphaerae bacterium GWF2_57_35]|nr:MAG: hypothetical protein A2X46_14745 [Lentisphaerae bacterium GWF2_57_35]